MLDAKARKELKSNAKKLKNKFYWSTVFVCLIISFIGMTKDIPYSLSQVFWPMHVISDVYNGNEQYDSYMEKQDNLYERPWVGSVEKDRLFIGYTKKFIKDFMIYTLISCVLMCLIGAPLCVGINRYFLCIRDGDKKISNLFYVFKEKCYFKTMFVFLRKTSIIAISFASIYIPVAICSFLYVCKIKYIGVIFIIMLLIIWIPMFYVIYDTRFVLYILAQDPKMKINEIFHKSYLMTRNQKINIFLVDLSFIGWQILNVCTLGIAGIFYVGPYILATNTELYIKQKILVKNNERI